MENYNTSLVQELRDTIKAQTLMKSPKVNEYIVPVIDINPKHARISTVVNNSNTSNSTGGTIFTPNSNMDFYLTNIAMSSIRDATATATLFYVSAVINGATKRICQIAGITLNANSQVKVINLTNPLKIDRGTVISFVSDTAVGNFNVAIELYGYYDEQSKS